MNAKFSDMKKPEVFAAELNRVIADKAYGVNDVRKMFITTYTCPADQVARMEAADAQKIASGTPKSKIIPIVYYAVQISYVADDLRNVLLFDVSNHKTHDAMENQRRKFERMLLALQTEAQDADDAAHCEAERVAAEAKKAAGASGFDMANDGRGFICGVPARMTNRNTYGRSGGRFFNQTIVTESRPAGGDYDAGCTIYAEIRFDDNCGNGHNDFAITATVMNPRRRGDCEACGCLHDDVARVFPELVHLIKWHLCSTDSPMHYVANTVYHASDCDTSGKRKGEVTRTETRLKFNGFPMTFAPKKILRDWLNSKPWADSIPDFEMLVTPVEHARETSGYQFDPKYTFAGCTACKWHEAPFDSIREAEEFRDALKQGWEWIVIPTAYSKGKARDFNAARNSGVWPDATDEQLSVPSDELKAALLERLPALQAAMKADITGAGLLWSSETN